MQWNPATIIAISLISVVVLTIAFFLVKFTVIEPLAERLAPEAEHERIQREGHEKALADAAALGLDVPKGSSTAQVRMLIGEHNRAKAREAAQAG